MSERRNMKKIVMIHTVPMIIENLTKLVNENIEGIEVENILDEYLLKYVGAEPKKVEERLQILVKLAKKGGAKEIIITCSSLSEVSRNIDGNVMMIDSFMHKEAVKYKKLLLIATAETAIEPTRLGIERIKRSNITLDETYVEGAMEKNKKGLRKEHDELIVKKLRENLVDKDYDGVVLCQASMAHLKNEIEGELDIKVLTNTEYFIKHLKTS